MYVEVVSGLGEALVGNWPGAALSFTAAKPPLAAAVAAARGSEGGPQVTNLQAELDVMRNNLQSASMCCCTCLPSIATCCHACWMTLQVWYLYGCG